MESAETQVKDRLDWERELLGVYLSEHPFSPFLAKAAAENTTLCGQVDGDMEGQTVVVAGMVDSIHGLMTRDGQPSASVMLEDLDGKLEVMVWSRVYAATREFWQEGNILLVDGKVRLRGDRVQLVCDHVRHYRLDETIERESVTTEMNKPTPLPAAVKYEKPAGNRRLIIKLKHTEDEAADVNSFRRVVGVLRDFPGDDEVRLVVDNTRKVYKMKLPGIGISYSPELHRRLAEIIGEDGMTLEGAD
jgi:DNA polymerase-3 subunit alpha